MGLISCQNTWFVINKHWQRLKGSSGCGAEDAEMWLGTEPDNAGTGEEDCKMGIGRAELPKYLSPATPNTCAGLLCNGTSLIQAKQEASRKNICF